MNTRQQRGICVAVWMLALAGLVIAEPVDPRFPSERPPPPSEVWSHWPPTRIEQLEAERARLQEKISALPQHDPKFLSDHFGYHSLVADPRDDGSVPPHQIDFTMSWTPVLDSIALAPAFNPEGSGVYAFPKRFKIELLNAATGNFEVVVDWMDEDFPDPGPYPVFFSGINRNVKQVRITVPQAVRESEMAYYALGEIYLFRPGENGLLGANIAAWGNKFMKVAASDSLTMRPLWDTEYLYDGAAGFGFPLSDETVASEDLMITYENGLPFSDKVQFRLDLGQVRDVGRIDFWPATAPHLLALPSFGFPEKISVEMSLDPDFKTVKVLTANNITRRMYRDNLLSLIGEGYDAQYIRITMEGLSEYKGKPILGMGEISVSNNEKVWSVNAVLSAQGIPKDDLKQLPRLTDGCSRNRRILLQGEWIKGLAKRRPLDRRLVVVERELELARATWRRIQFRSSVWGGCIITLALAAGMVLQRRQRRKVLENLRWQIAHDLHDEVGSSLGSISLTAEQLEHEAMDAGMKEDLGDLSLMAREACASLREVVWVIDQTTIHLPALIQKLVERAEWVLGGVELSVETPQDCPDTVVSFPFKRHLIMFFKEAVHNCARHAQATQVRIAVEITGPQLQVTVSDNGCGFDLSELKDGWGLANMKKRAQELGGEMELESQPGSGTSITLKVPLIALPNEPTLTYKTSN